LRRIVGEPLFAFAVAGLALFGLFEFVSGDDAEPVQLTVATRAALLRDFEAVAGRKAGAEDLARLEHDYIADELLFRDAIANGLHLTDGTVRGRLVEVMRLRAAGELPEPTPEELVNHYSEHLDRYRSEPAASFEQVYFAGQPVDPAATLAALRTGQRVAGEPFPQGERFPRYGQSMLRGLLGQPFVEALWAAPVGQWSGPILSSEGWHYVLVTERLPPQLLPFDEVREQVETDFLAAAIQDAVDRRVAELGQRYEVRMERSGGTGAGR
jgi:hypothetical protein